MPLYTFRIQNGSFSGEPCSAFDLEDRNAAWIEMTKVCSDLIGGIARHLKQKSDWQLELLDEAKKPLFRIRLVAETLDGNTAIEKAPSRRRWVAAQMC